MAHDSGLSDETMAGGTPDDIDPDDVRCEQCGRRVKVAEATDMSFTGPDGERHCQGEFFCGECFNRLVAFGDGRPH